MIKRLKFGMFLFLMMIFAASGPGLFYVYHYYIAPNVGTVVVVKAMDDIPRGRTIESKQLAEVQIKTEEFVDGAYIKKDALIGKETRFPIRKGQQVIPEMIDEKGLDPNPDQWNTPIPNDWIFAMPGSLLRGDRISLFAVPPEKAQEQSEINFANGEMLAPQKPKVLSPEELKAEVNKYKIPVLTNLAVSYSKSNNNVEVTTADNKRLQPTGNVHSIEIIVNQPQWEKILSYSLQGYKFIVMYN